MCGARVWQSHACVVRFAVAAFYARARAPSREPVVNRRAERFVHLPTQPRSALAKGVGGGPHFQVDPGLLLEITRELPRNPCRSCDLWSMRSCACDPLFASPKYVRAYQSCKCVRVPFHVTYAGISRGQHASACGRIRHNNYNYIGNCKGGGEEIMQACEGIGGQSEDGRRIVM